MSRLSNGAQTFLERPVTTPAGIELDTELAEAVRNLAEGKSPFGLKGLFGKSAQKKQLDSIRVLGNPPADAESWKHVAEHLALLKCLRELALRWNALAHELQLEAGTGGQAGRWLGRRPSIRPLPQGEGA